MSLKLNNVVLFQRSIAEKGNLVHSLPTLSVTRYKIPVSKFCTFKDPSQGLLLFNIYLGIVQGC